MSALPDRPNLDQLRRQARDLLRAAASSKEEALRRMRAVSAQQTLSGAQLAIAREYGFASWPRLRAEVLRRGHVAEAEAGAGTDAGNLAIPAAEHGTESPAKSWQEMREWCARLLASRTG